METSDLSPFVNGKSLRKGTGQALPIDGSGDRSEASYSNGGTEQRAKDVFVDRGLLALGSVR